MIGSIKRTIDEGLRINLKSISNMKILYKFIFKMSIPKTAKDVEYMEKAIETYEKINAELQETINARKKNLEIIKKKMVREERI